MLTVVIPTYKRPHSVLNAMRSIQQQTLLDLEVIVVDNAADPDLEKQVVEFNRTAKRPIRHVAEPNLGLHNARHAGARAAKGDVLVFTDDDATFDPGWAKAYADAFLAHPEMAAAAGPIEPAWESPPPQWLSDYCQDHPIFTILSLWKKSGEFTLEKDGFFFGVNMAIRSRHLFEAGGFNPESFGDVWLGDGESGLNRKLWSRGHLIGYIPEALVYHHVPPSRMTTDYFCRRMANEGACDMYQEFHAQVPGTMRLLRTWLWLYRRHRNLWKQAAGVAGQTSRSSLELQMQSARTRSQWHYVGRLIHDRQFRTLVTKKTWLD